MTLRARPPASDAGEVSPGSLFVVGTPIGNLEDVTLRALRILREVDCIVAEDTRVTRRLLSRYAIDRPLVSLHAHSAASRTDDILARLSAGQSLALVTDAGTPGISDPGGLLVRGCLERGIPVVPVPGPSAVTAALSCSGLDPSRFVFLGFLPRKQGSRRRLLSEAITGTHTLVFFESPQRLSRTLEDCLAVLGNRQAVVCRELTKRFEESRRGDLHSLSEAFRETPVKGEVVVLLEGKEDGTPSTARAPDAAGAGLPTAPPDAVRAALPTAPPDAAGAGLPTPPPDAAGAGLPTPPPDVVDELRRLLAGGLSTRDASRRVAEERGLPRKELYRLAVETARPGGASGGD